MTFTVLSAQDQQIASLIQRETERQEKGLVMIPSENYASPAVLAATGSILTNKYAEGYPAHRYYTGNEVIDEIEQLAITRAQQLFQVEHVNVQPHSGSGANMAAYMAVLQPHDTILAMDLSHGGHLTHGSRVNFSGQTYKFIHYGVQRDTEQLDMDHVRALAREHRPKLILGGITSYPRRIDFQALYDIATEVNAYAMADISHIAGLCVAGLHPNPCSYYDIVTTTTTKTLRGPRSAVILSKNLDRWNPNAEKTLAQRIDAAVFPGIQGGPFEHVIAAKAVCFFEALQPKFHEYQQQIFENAQTLAAALIDGGLRLVSGGTDNHLMLIDCTPLGITGKQGAQALARLGIYTNFNMIPYDTRKPFNPSGIRLGTPALTTRGFSSDDMQVIGTHIAAVLQHIDDDSVADQTQKMVKELTQNHPFLLSTSSQ